MFQYQSCACTSGINEGWFIVEYCSVDEDASLLFHLLSMYVM